MKDSTLVQIALGTSFFGLGVLLAIFLFLEPASYSGAEVELLEDGSKVTIQGEITNLQQRGNLTIASIETSCEIDAVIFENFNTTGCVRIRGEKSSYKGKAQINVERITSCYQSASLGK